ncbi:hypothetical protein LTR56_020022 [Elasticomyces elasticus]|nr:hypothetical protein LTR56_020022 [Elasticomyces elasticus]KAK3634157.1 hypothetical protein LTR22_019766 [Elasticomyces elasticus]KAK4911221.1 hypothetical protein LTR49_020187 [Elasticomyces elasticus]KAK5750700.1 hypothetical protein LTS12_019231 [Elasticomyces elasticus]
MSLAILPSSPIAYGQTPVPTLLPPGPSLSKRPKLSLDTLSNPTIYGKKSTSLRLETLSTTSPTVRNTFQNGYNVSQQPKTPSGKRPSLMPLATNVQNVTPRRQPTPLRTELPSVTDVPELVSSSAASSASISTPMTRPGGTKHHFARFPTSKKVLFRAPLTEEIKTSKYTMAHSDIESMQPSLLPMGTKGALLKEKSGGKTATIGSTAKKPSTASAQPGEKRESSDEEDSDTCPVTPVAGRRKKSRVWRWTLSPVNGSSEQEDSDDVDIDEEKHGAT